MFVNSRLKADVNEVYMLLELVQSALKLIHD